ncbi:MAG TPA: DoxX family protein [Kofleriaceae bacterium]|jgi:putative oxidoreductase|nr:DoxX family protein [Kofleriaceae bacterium]
MPTSSPSLLFRVIDQLDPIVYPALRIVAGAMFACHGMQKLFGAFGGEAVPLFSQMGLGGVIELVGGILVAIGLITRLAAFLMSGQMAVAFFQFHVIKTGQLLPIQNGADDTVLYCFVFLMFFVRGPGGYALDNRIFGATS